MAILDLVASPTPTFVTLVCCGFIYSAVLVIYRIFLHPLRKFPGPKLAAATRWYEFYFDIFKGDGGQFAREIDRMHEVYGPIVRINPEELHVNDPDYYEVLYAGNPTNRNKWPAAAKMTGVPLASFGTVDHNAHRKRRAANSSFFSKRAIMEAESLIKEEVERLCHQIQNCHIRNEVIELHVRFLAFTTDTISSFAFAETLGLQEDYNQAEDWAETLRKIGKVTPLLRQFPSAISIALKMPFRVVEFVVPALSRMLKLHHRTQSIASEFLENEKINPSPVIEKRSTRPPTIFHAIHQSTLGPEEKTLDRLSQEGVLMFAAGSEGTSRILMLATYYLLMNPTALTRLRAEIMNIMPDSRIIPSMGVLRELPWLHAVVKETLRNSAIFTSRFPLYSPYNLQFQEWTIPSKTPISMTTRSVLKDCSIFPSPDIFDPERWLQGSSVHHDLDRYYVPFGKGTRMCPGMDLAYTEIHMGLVVLFRRFELELFDTVKERDIDVVRDCFMGEASPHSLGVRVKVKKALS